MSLICESQLMMQSSESPSLPMKIIGTKQPDAEYTERSAVRVVVKDADEQVIIIKVNKGNYYKLPGDGVEGDEDHGQAAVREVAEETGCSVATEGGHVVISEVVLE